MDALREQLEILKGNMREQDLQKENAELRIEQELLNQRERLGKKHEYDIAIISKEKGELAERLRQLEEKSETIQRESEQIKYESQMQLMNVKAEHEKVLMSLNADHSYALEAKSNAIKDLEKRLMEFKSHQDDEDAATADRNAYANELDDATAELKLREQELKVIKAEMKHAVQQSEISMHAHYGKQLKRKDEAIAELKNVVTALLEHAENMHAQKKSARNAPKRVRSKAPRQRASPLRREKESAELDEPDEPPMCPYPTPRAGREDDDYSMGITSITDWNCEPATIGANSFLGVTMR